MSSDNDNHKGEDMQRLWYGLVFALGLAVGATAYYTYANYLYRQHPEFFRELLERKIARRHKRA